MNNVSKAHSKQALWTLDFITILTVNALGFLGFNMATAGAPAYLSFLGAENTVTGLVTTLAAVAALSIRPFIGYLLSRTTAKNISCIGFMLMALPTLALSSFKSFISILVIRLLQGFGWGLASTGCSSIIAQTTPDSRLSEGIGFSGAVSSVTTAIAPVFAILLLEKASGTTMMICMGVILLISGLLVFRLRSAKYSGISKTERKQGIGFFETGALFPAILILCITICYSPIITFIVPAAKENGLSNVTIFYIFYAIATVTVRPLTGFFVDRHGSTIPAFLSLSTAILSVLLMSVAHTPSILCIAGISSGMSTGIGMNALQIMALKRVSDRKKGLAMSTFLFGFDMGMALGAIAAGIISKWFGYNIMFVSFALFPLIGIIALSLLILKNKYMKNRKRAL